MKIEEFSDQARDFLSNIKNGDVKGVGNFIDDNKEIAPFSNEEGESAAAIALKSKQLAVYEALISRAWCLNSSENFHEIVNKFKKILRAELREIHEKFQKQKNDLTSLIDTFLDRNRYISPNNYEEEKSALTIKYEQLISDDKVSKIVNEFAFAFKSELREINKRNFIKNPNEEHLTSLITRTSIYFGGNEATRNRKNYLDLIAGAYEQLNDIREIRSIFEVVAKIKNLIIIFDFDRDSIEHVDPAGNPNIQGRTYAETGEVYIGAKALTEANRSEALGVLAHELCHVAIFRIYNNDCKPYHKNDSEGEKEFESVLCDCEKKLGKEMYIDVVLNGPEVIMHDELCVRVPHLLALYQGNDGKIKFLKQTFKKLFDYFEKKTLLDLKKENELMSAVWKLKSKEPQHLTDSSILMTPKTLELDLDAKKVFEISSNCPQATLNWIFQESMKKLSYNFLFLDMKHLKVAETYKLVVKAHSSCMKPRIVINCDKETKPEIGKIAEEMKQNKINERIIFVQDHEEFLINDSIPYKISHSWNDLEDQSKENLIKTMISFQGVNLLLEEIVNHHCDALEFVSLKELLDNYLKIGNDVVFPEVDIYVKRKFQSDETDDIEPSELLNIAVTSKFILLSDDPGMGKTTELKIIAKEFKKKLKSFWIAFVDLKVHSESYEKDRGVKTEFNSSEEVSNFFAKKIFKLNEFEERIFKYLFGDDRVVLLLDGFDEISPSFKKFVTMFIKSTRTHSRNILITSTRPHLKEELCQVFNVEAYNLMPITEKNCFEIIELNFEKKGIAGEDLEKKIDRTKKFYDNLKMTSEPVKNPLILGMIAKLFSDDHFAEVMQPNIFSIYKNFVEMMIMESMVKGHDARQEATNSLTSGLSIIKFYHKEAFKVIFDVDDLDEDDDNEEEDDEDKFKKCFHLCFSEVESLPDEQITRIALMKSDVSGKNQFNHQKFAEFFVADFLFKNAFDLKALKDRKRKVSKKRLKSILEIIREVFKSNRNFSRYFPMRSFLDGAFEKSIQKIEELDKEVLMSNFKEIFTGDLFPKYFLCFAADGLLNLVTVISRCADKQDLKRLWVEPKLTNPMKGPYSIFMWAAEFGPNYFAKLTELAREVLDEKDFLNFFTEINENGDSVASLAYHNNRREAFDFYVQSEFLPSPFVDFPDIELYFKIESKLIEPLRKEGISGFRYAVEKVKEEFGLEDLHRFLNSWRTDGEPIYFFALRHCQLSSIKNFNELWNFLRRILGENVFKSLLIKPIKYGATPLQLKASRYKKEVFISFWKILTEGLTDDEQEKCLIEETNDGDNIFDCATINEDPETFLAIKNLYLTIIGEDKMRIMLTRERKPRQKVLFDAARFGFDNVATMKALWTFLQEIFDVLTQKSFIMETDDFGHTFYCRLKNSKYFNKKIKIVEPFIEQHLTELEKYQFKHGIVRGSLRDYFTKKNGNGESIVSLAFKTNRSDPSFYDQLSELELYSIIEFQIFQFFTKQDLFNLRNELEKIEETVLGLEYFQHILSSFTIVGDTFYFRACQKLARLEDFEKLWNLFRRIIGENDFKALLKKPDRHGKTLLMFKAEFCSKEIFVSFWRLLTEGLTKEEKQKLLFDKKVHRNNSFDRAVRSKNLEKFHAIKDLYLQTLGEDKMRIILTREEKNGQTIMHDSIQFGEKNVETVEALWTLIQEICDVSSQKKILLSTDEYGKTVFRKIGNKRDFDMKMKIFEPFIEQHLTAREKKKFKKG